VFRIDVPTLINGKLVHIFAAGTEEFRRRVNTDNIISCEIGASSHKSGPLTSHNVKVIGRRNERESQLLDDLCTWCLYSGSTSQEPLFSRRVFSGKQVTFAKLVPKKMALLIKATAASLGFDPKEFANHSLRKGSLTQMRASGCREDESIARGNYAPGSLMPSTTYNHDNTGRGPSGSSSSGIGREVNRLDVQRNSKSARFR
jgi:hypothetical protein